MMRYLVLVGQVMGLGSTLVWQPVGRRFSRSDDASRWAVVVALDEQSDCQAHNGDPTSIAGAVTTRTVVRWFPPGLTIVE